MRCSLFSRFILLTAIAGLSACSTISQAPVVKVEKNVLWVVAPFANHTETPLAGARAAAIGEALLIAQGEVKVRRFETSAPESPFETAPAKLRSDALSYARRENARYLITGSVDEWRYKQGVDGEPAVGLVMTLIDVSSGEAVWTAVGGKTGWSRESLAAVGQQLINELMKPLLTQIK